MDFSRGSTHSFGDPAYCNTLNFSEFFMELFIQFYHILFYLESEGKFSGLN